MCYYWGELDDPIVTRLALPLHFLLVLLAVAGWREITALWPGRLLWRWPALAIAGALLVFTAPTVARDRYVALNATRNSFEWQQRVVARFWPAPDLVITNRSPICWLAEGIPGVSIDHVRRREKEMKWHLDRHSFPRVLVMQRVLPLGAEGWAVDAPDALPPHWQLEEVAVRRIGFSLARVSRLIAIGEPAPAQPDTTISALAP
jgi:hypothetical protein